MSKQRLTVHELRVADAWKDMARIPHAYRKDASGKNIRRNKICDVTIGDKHKLLAIRGCSEKDARIQLDSHTRLELGVRDGDSCEVELRPRPMDRLLAMGMECIRSSLSRTGSDKPDLPHLGHYRSGLGSARPMAARSSWIIQR